MSKEIEKLVKAQISNEISRCYTSIAYTTTNKVIEQMKSSGDQLIKLEAVSVNTDDDGLTKIEIVLRSI